MGEGNLLDLICSALRISVKIKVKNENHPYEMDISPTENAHFKTANFM